MKRGERLISPDSEEAERIFPFHPGGPAGADGISIQGGETMKHSFMKRFLALLLSALLLGGMFTCAWADPDEAEPDDPENGGTLTLVEPAGEPDALGQPGADEPQGDPDLDDDEVPIVYDVYLWLGEKAVHAGNADDPLENGQVSFDRDTNTLTFTAKSPTIPGLHNGALIDAPGLESLTIVTAAGGLKINSDTATCCVNLENGALTVNGALDLTLSLSTADAAVYVGGGASFNGSVDLGLPGMSSDCYGVKSINGPVAVNGNFFVIGGHTGIYCGSGDVTITGDGVFMPFSQASLGFSPAAGIYAADGGVDVQGSYIHDDVSIYLIYANGPIHVGGEVQVENTAGIGGGGNGFKSLKGGIVFDGSATIEIGGGTCIDSGDAPEGIVIKGKADLTAVTGGTPPAFLSAAGGPILVDGDLRVAGSGLDLVYAKGDITVLGDASIKNSLTATTVMPYDGRAMTSAEGSVSITGSLTSTSSNSGVYAKKDITIGGDATVGVSDRNERDYILKAETGELSIGGSLTTTGLAPASAYGAAGLTVGQNVTITNGAEDAVGLYSEGKITMVSGEWDISAKQPLLAKSGIQIPETHSVILPEGGVVSQLDGGFAITEQDGTTIPEHVIISDAAFITITFDLNYAGSEPVQMMIHKGAAVGKLPSVWSHGEAPALWYLIGWYTEAAEGLQVGRIGKKVTARTTFDEDATVYAHWYLPGDVNGDGSVDNRDVTRLIRCIRYGGVETVEYALDPNADGYVDNLDVSCLIRYLGHKDVEIY